MTLQEPAIGEIVDGRQHGDRRTGDGARNAAWRATPSRPAVVDGDACDDEDDDEQRIRSRRSTGAMGQRYRRPEYGWYGPPDAVTVLQLRSRRGLVAALLVLLVALFAARAVVHHVAEDVAPPSAIGHHEDGDHGLALDLVAAAPASCCSAPSPPAGVRPARPSGFVFAVPRFARSPAPLPRGRPPRALRARGAAVVSDVSPS